ncbi:MAG: topoisomerase DNA-binding C4 zinc finger domain-containing protein [Clostridia bacterium]|nr:topoisomerase DNA-binding C4 zinc finger domain-containing protein [Clostridia bacterium]
MQNRSHIKHLKAFAGDLPTVSVIVFSERCTLKSITVTSCDIKVIKRNDVLKTVNSIYSTADTVLSAEDINALYEKLYPLTQVNDAVKAQHIENINAKQGGAAAPEASVAVNIENSSEHSVITEADGIPSANEGDCATVDPPPLICPRCGKELLLRTATRGENAGKQFYGCSGFPRCRYIQNVEE